MADFSKLKQKSRSNYESLANKVKDMNRKADYSDDRFWELTRDKAGNGMAVIRFLPDPNHEEFVRMYTHGFKHKGKYFIENCPTSIGLPCPVCEANKELWATESEANQKIVRDRKRKVNYISNINVLS